MNGLVIGLYAVFLLMVGFNGNSDELIKKLRNDAPGFLPWAVSLGVLAVAYDNKNTRPVAEPFIFLLILTFVVKNFGTLESQAKQIYSMAENAARGSK